MCDHLKLEGPSLKALCLRKCSVTHLMNKSVLMYDDFGFMYTSDPGSKPSPNLCFC
jgi:hypothetical protein